MRKLAFCFLVCLLNIAPALAGDVVQLHLQLSSLKTLQADFEQDVFDEDGTLLQQSRGELMVERPNKLRWESREPFHYLLISDGETLWRYDADLEQLNTEAFSPELAQTPALIIGASIAELESRFEVAMNKQGAQREFILKPRSPEMFSQMTLRFNKGKLVGMAMLDNLAQRTEIRLTSPRYNKAIPAGDFRFNEASLSQ